jgi:hypothetical protein
LLDIGGFRDNLPIAYDPDIMFRLGEVASFGAVQQPVFLYRLSNESITAPGRLDAVTFLSGFAFCYSARAALVLGEPEPDLNTFLKDYVVKEEEVDNFTINQAIQSINTRWVNTGIVNAIFFAMQTLLLNPLLFSKYTAKRLSYWRKSKN